MTPVMKAINIMTKHEINKAMVDLPMSVKKYRKYSKIKKNCEREEDETSVQPAATTDFKAAGFRGRIEGNQIAYYALSWERTSNHQKKGEIVATLP